MNKKSKEEMKWAQDVGHAMGLAMALQTRLDEIIKYCEPHQQYMWAKYITGIAKAKKDWRDRDAGPEPGGEKE